MYIDNQIDYVYARLILVGNANGMVDVEAVKHFHLQWQQAHCYAARHYQFGCTIVG